MVAAFDELGQSIMLKQWLKYCAFAYPSPMKI
jgi:hypothetical protein